MGKRKQGTADGSSPVRVESRRLWCVSGITERGLCQLPGTDTAILLDIALLYFVSRIN